MTVLNVLSTNAIAAGATEYQVVKTGFYRVIATAGDAVYFGDDVDNFANMGTTSDSHGGVGGY